jgi:hypothetical protein
VIFGVTPLTTPQTFTFVGKWRVRIHYYCRMLRGSTNPLYAIWIDLKSRWLWLMTQLWFVTTCQSVTKC